MPNENVLLYSAGLDSLILRYTIKVRFDHFLYFDTGTKEGKREIDNLDYKTKVIPLPLARFELDNKIIPFRNYLFVLLAANYGNNIYIGSTAGDTTRDKDRVFQGLCGSVLNYFGAIHEKMPYAAENFQVIMPFKDQTKTEILARFLQEYSTESGEVDRVLKGSRSCYEGDLMECGHCRSCLRKSVAFWLNKKESLLQFPFPSNPELKSLHQQSKNKGRSQKELDEIMACIERKR